MKFGPTVFSLIYFSCETDATIKVSLISKITTHMINNYFKLRFVRTPFDCPKLKTIEGIEHWATKIVMCWIGKFNNVTV